MQMAVQIHGMMEQQFTTRVANLQRINNCYFIGNRVSDNGGAIFNANTSNANITNCIFTLNYATDAGGAMGKL